MFQENRSQIALPLDAVIGITFFSNVGVEVRTVHARVDRVEIMVEMVKDEEEQFHVFRASEWGHDRKDGRRHLLRINNSRSPGERRWLHSSEEYKIDGHPTNWTEVEVLTNL